eukprot:CAMPEP_0178662882 /NCGR_PEP_ID=MMETSP0698-20121128/28505_1 /TAXON_ID=265572 /ORGANISM="Extubocellulus spinifer, Strain CCMP396" /LENGTH=301 /DNA_ID=CAMNT_0020305855 /DNA_START=25 /DNA_END=931 /DNA_ORIENTATION=+
MKVSPAGIVLCSALTSGVVAGMGTFTNCLGGGQTDISPLFASVNNNDYQEDHGAVGSFTGDFLVADSEDTTTTLATLVQGKLSIAAPLAVALLPVEVNAADGSSGGQIASALAAYGHFLSLFVIVGCLVTERLTIKANMSDEEEDRLAVADTTLGVAGFLLAYTGYLRTTADWGKGFDYYAHEPIFWLKTLFVAIFGAVSFFPTTKIIQRSVAKRNGNLVPMSEELAGRMTSLVNAELLMIGSIPLTASLMARGVGYMPNFPWQAGAGVTVAALGGLGFKYVKEALDWQEPVTSAAVEADK